MVTLVDREADLTPRRWCAEHQLRETRRHLNDTLLGWMHLYKKPLLCVNPAEDERFRGAHWAQSVRSMLCVPLVVKSELIGVITCYNKKGGGEFTEEDQRLLAIIAGQSAQIVENARLYEEEKALTGMKEQLRRARFNRACCRDGCPQMAGFARVGRAFPHIRWAETISISLRRAAGAWRCAWGTFPARECPRRC